MKNTALSFFFFLAFLPFAGAQQRLTAEDAVGIALKNNYDIRIAGASSDINKANNTPGNAGMLPNIGANGSGSYSWTHIDQNVSGGTSISYPDNRSATFDAGVDLGWTLFDGGKMFVTKKKLNEIEKQGEIQFRDQVQQTTYDVITGYYDVVRQKQQLASDQEAINYSAERVKILQAGFNAGVSQKTDLLQAQIDLNVARENAIVQEALIIAVKRLLNQLLSRDADIPFDVADSIVNTYVPDKPDLVKKLFANNTSILSLEKQVSIERLNVKQYQTLRYPVLNLNAGYYFSWTDNSHGSVLKNQVYGPQVGGTITIPLYEGGNINRQVKTARLQLDVSGYDLENTRLTVNTQLQNALTAFEYQQKLLKIERENTSLVKENLDISLHRLRLGQTTALEVRQAQESYENCHTRLINFEYNLKLAETRLKQLIAGL
jgi:outer membrane protein